MQRQSNLSAIIPVEKVTFSRKPLAHCIEQATNKINREIDTLIL